MAVKVRPQMKLFDKTIDDSVLEDMLIQREHKREALVSSREAFNLLDDDAKARIKDLKISGTVRCGAFAISVKTAAGRSVEFETKPSKRIRISPVKEW